MKSEFQGSSDKFEAYADRNQALRAIILIIAFTAGATAMIQYPDFVERYARQSKFFVQLVGWCLLPVMFKSLIIKTIQLIDRRVQLTVNDQGFFYRFKLTKFVPWSEVHCLKLKTRSKHSYLSVEFKDPSSFAKSGYAHLFYKPQLVFGSRFPFLFGSRDLEIDAVSLDCATEDILRAIQRHRPDLYPTGSELVTSRPLKTEHERNG